MLNTRKYAVITVHMFGLLTIYGRQTYNEVNYIALTNNR